MFRERFTRVTVDEFQDTNALQMRLLQQLVGPPYHVCVVGDDDQSIYGWRGAEVANILEFERFFPDPEDHPAGGKLPLHPRRAAHRQQPDQTQPRPPRENPALHPQGRRPGAHRRHARR